MPGRILGSTLSLNPDVPEESRALSESLRSAASHMHAQNAHVTRVTEVLRAAQKYGWIMPRAGCPVMIALHT